MSHLTQEQRYKIEVLNQQNYTQTAIGKILGRDKSVICRELVRNADLRSGTYKGDLAHRKTQKRHKEKRKKIHFTSEIEQHVNHWIQEDYSPEQIAGVSKKDGIICVSHERIYQHLWQDKKQGGTLYKHLRTKGRRYRKRGAAKDKRGQIVGRIGIENRPQIVDEKTRFGDLEIDLVIGKNHKEALVTMNDRATGLCRIKKVSSKDSSEVEKAVIDGLKEWKNHLFTITSDNGKEFANHQKIAVNLEIDYFFANPYHSWERGANENLNGLIRQYFPKKSGFKDITDELLKEIENKLNNRPRKKFGYKTPNEVYLQIINQNRLDVAFIT